jgi:hypothetical protein
MTRGHVGSKSGSYGLRSGSSRIEAGLRRALHGKAGRSR